jgi:penicillin amidase
MKKSLGAITAALGAAAGLAGLGYYWLFQRPQARQKGVIRPGTGGLPGGLPGELPGGLQAPVEVIRDRWGVPHIYAGSIPDALFAQGYLHAEERLWQMDFNRRLVAGRIAEILGAVALPLDRWMRILGMRRVAARQPDLLEPETRHYFEAYAAGVNARIAQGRLPVEFTLLRYKPEPWTIVDSLSWTKMMAWTLSVNWETEILRARFIERLGAEKAAGLEVPYFEGWPRVIPAGVDPSALSQEALQRAAAARRFTGPPAAGGLGSNNWVLSGQRTSTGLPLLANDMHLTLSAPAIWYENHLVAGELNVTGVSFPGLPGVIAGHNQHVAWGFTNGFPDVQDLYIEQTRRTQDGRVEYLFQDEWLPAEVLQETIQVKGAEPETQEVIFTRHGPIINALSPELAAREQPLALRWTALEPDTMVQALMRMNLAKSCQEFRAALREWTVPVQNTVYADTQGNIAYSFPGKVPVRAKGDGRLPVPGWTGEYEWTGYIPYEELPHLFNPPQGYIVSANNRVVGDDYPHFLGYDHVSGNRARRIVELIEAQETIDPAYIQRMHVDQVSDTARAIARSLADLPADDPELQAVLRRLREWDGTLSADSPLAAVYEVFVRRMILRLTSEPLGGLAMHYLGKGITPVLAEASLFGERSREWLRLLLEKPGEQATWFEVNGVSQRQELLRAGLRETIDYLKETCGPQIEDWAWGKLHPLVFNHTLGSVKPLNVLFNRGPFPLGGDGDTVWAAGSSYTELGPQPVIGPPFRFIANLQDWNQSLGQLVPGQSGHPRSPHYADNIQAWLRGEYHPMPFDRPSVLQAAATVLRLEPAS